MDEPVKRTRRYTSPHRVEQAAATRRQILDVAQRLFEEHGYVATSMAAIAAEAGVSLRTVYLGFASKPGLLIALWHLLLRGDEGPAPVGERSWFRAVLAKPDPSRQLRLNARNARIVRQRAGRILRVIRDAAQADPELAALWERIQAEFYENQRAVVASLAEKGAMRPDLDEVRATDLLWTLNHPDLYGLLVDDRGWSADSYEAWLGDALCRELLAPPREPAT